MHELRRRRIFSSIINAYSKMSGNARVMKCHRQAVGGLKQASGFTKVLPFQQRSLRASPMVHAERKAATMMVDGGAFAKKIGAAVGHVSLVGVLLLSGGLFS